MSGETPQLNRSLSEWSVRLAANGFADVARRLNEDKSATVRRLVDLGLPHFDFRLCPTDDFLHEPHRYFDQLDSTAFYATLIPDAPDQERVKDVCLDRAATRDYVEREVRAAPPGTRYGSLILMETAAMVYGANIAIGGDAENPVYAEVVQGTHSDLVGDQQPLVLSLHRAAATNSLIRWRRHNPDDTDYGERVRLNHDELLVRRALIGALHCLPHDQVERDHSPEFTLSETRFRPGYYELCLIESAHGSWLDPRFIDSSDEPLFVPDGMF